MKRGRDGARDFRAESEESSVKGKRASKTITHEREAINQIHRVEL